MCLQPSNEHQFEGFGTSYAKARRDYMDRWRAKVTQMRNLQDTKEHIKIFVKGTLPIFCEKLYYMPLTEFSQMYEVKIPMEDKIREEKKYRNHAGNFSRSRFKGLSQSTKTPSTNKNTAAITLDLRATNVLVRRFSNFGTPLSRVFNKVESVSLLRLLAP
ncbi:hypothetical protein JCGZ_12665 [Jatropha curcas]|uniref:Uncharacterized protein n=1 Tax=Jatropha curcas TaxID=180498 RepID=A0A067KDY9_JATCU|nr:hypothetical protein JCGZ_12665 [Jatropha curcas]